MEYFLRISLNSVEKGPGLKEDFVVSVLLEELESEKSKSSRESPVADELRLLSLSLSELLSIFSFLIFIKAFCILSWVFGLALPTLHGSTANPFCRRISLIFPCLQPICNNSLCFCLNAVSHTVHLRSSIKEANCSESSFMKCLQQCCSKL